MVIKYPHVIRNCVGETITFLGIENAPGGDKVHVEASVEPGCGPAMHTHLKQDEELTIVTGRMQYQVLGEEPKLLLPGETVLFRRGTPHKFWNAGEELLTMRGVIQPAHSVVFFLSALYAAQNKSGKNRPEAFDGAYLVTRYAAEYDIAEIPVFIKKTLFPFTYWLGRLLGKYNHFKDAPEPLKASDS